MGNPFCYLRFQTGHVSLVALIVAAVTWSAIRKPGWIWRYASFPQDS